MKFWAKQAAQAIYAQNFIPVHCSSSLLFPTTLRLYSSLLLSAFTPLYYFLHLFLSTFLYLLLSTSFCICSSLPLFSLSPYTTFRLYSTPACFCFAFPAPNWAYMKMKFKLYPKKFHTFTKYLLFSSFPLQYCILCKSTIFHKVKNY